MQLKKKNISFRLFSDAKYQFGPKKAPVNYSSDGDFAQKRKILYDTPPIFPSKRQFDATQNEKYASKPASLKNFDYKKQK